jgi:hypothetical protein
MRQCEFNKIGQSLCGFFRLTQLLQLDNCACEVVQNTTLFFLFQGECFPGVQNDFLGHGVEKTSLNNPTRDKRGLGGSGATMHPKKEP